jgi:CheY-like chemotaxis protein
VFDRFVQGAQGVDRAGGGLGLGLAFVRMLLHMHGGTVEAASEHPGGGSTFTLRVPLEHERDRVSPVGPSAREAAPEAAREAKSSPGRRILVVDDNEDAASLLGAILERSGHTVEISHEPLTALAIAESFRPELAVLDIGLPSMDGYTLATRLREQLAPAPIGLIALTGYGQPGDRERSRAAGFAAHLVKPVVAKDLLEAITALNGVEPGSPRSRL